MIVLNPYFLEHAGKKAFAVLPYEEYVKLEETLEDYEDLMSLRQAKEKEQYAASISLSDAKEILNIC